MWKRWLSVALLALVIGTSGCAAHRRKFENYHRDDLVQTYIEPRRCHDINELDYVCDGVVFRRRFRPAK